MGVSDGNAAELHAAAAFALGAPVLGVLDPRAGKINFNDLCGGGEEPLKIVQVGAQRAHRLRQAPGHQRKGGEVAGRHFSLDDEQAAEEHRQKPHKLGAALDVGEEFQPGKVGLEVCLAVFFVAVLEFFVFIGLAHERAHRFVARDVFLRHRVHAGQLFPQGRIQRIHRA